MWHPSLRTDKTFSQNLASGALSFTTSIGRRFRLDAVVLKSTVPITEIVTVTLDSVNGSAYDTVLCQRELSGSSSFLWQPEGDLFLQSGDEIRVECTQANATGTVSGAVKTSEVLK